MRGKVPAAPDAADFWRITPACAGKSLQQGGRSNIFWDHPRVCGEKYVGLAKNVLDKGSPPRVRGKVLFAVKVLFQFGITPACAGKRSARPPGHRSPRDHPRVCGEKRCDRPYISGGIGSPPRVRGKEDFGKFGGKYLRITPACAGKSCFNSAIARFSWDHPRVCGEKSFSRLPAFFLSGSPPRVRGKV